jgi:hypothetical protein
VPPRLTFNNNSVVWPQSVLKDLNIVLNGNSDYFIQLHQSVELCNRGVVFSFRERRNILNVT